jgi:hypothetical protein
MLAQRYEKKAKTYSKRPVCAKKKKKKEREMWKFSKKTVSCNVIIMRNSQLII